MVSLLNLRIDLVRQVHLSSNFYIFLTGVATNAILKRLLVVLNFLRDISVGNMMRLR